MEPYLALIGFNILFFWKYYRNPFLACTSELASTFFPYLIYQGRHGNKDEQIYYYFPRCIPFLSTFYPLNFGIACLSRLLTLDVAFRLYQAMINIHLLIGSCFAFYVFSSWTSPILALVGALSVAYGGYAVKIYQPCIPYTMAWLPGMLLPGPIGGICFGMAILAGYWPILIYFAPFALLAQFHWGYSWGWLGLGLLIGSPQICTFLWYLPQSVRAKGKSICNKLGKVPIYRFLNIIWPDRSIKKINGVLSQEMAMYLGLLPFFIFFSKSLIWWVLGFCTLGMVGLFPLIPRIPARWTHLFSFSLAWLAIDGLTRANFSDKVLIVLALLQAFLLLQNRVYLNYGVFTEWWKKPSDFWPSYSKLYNNSSITSYNSVFPHFTGYMTETVTPGYTGGFALQWMHDKYGITDPNGERITHA